MHLLLVVVGIVVECTGKITFTVVLFLDKFPDVGCLVPLKLDSNRNIQVRYGIKHLYLSDRI